MTLKVKSAASPEYRVANSPPPLNASARQDVPPKDREPSDGQDAPQTEASRLVRLRQAQDLLGQCLHPAIDQLFAALGGVRLHIDWSPVPSNQPSPSSPTCPLRCQRLSRRPPHRTCQECAARLENALRPAHRSRGRLHGACGRSLFFLNIVLHDALIARAILQSPPGKCRPQTSGNREKPPPSNHTRLRSRDAQHARPDALRPAIHLLELLVKALEWKAENLDLTAQQNLLERQLRDLRTEERRLRQSLHHRLPELTDSVPPSSAQNPRERLLQMMTDYVRDHFHRPLTLGEMAGALHRNASYLSHVFSQATGITFHHYLDEYRLSRAKQLLQDPHRNIADIAASVGYASDDWFRHAFKNHTGLAPSEWRRSGPAHPLPRPRTSSA